MMFLNGNYVNYAGEYFEGLNKENVEYAFMDLDDNGRTEMLVRYDGKFLPSIYKMIKGHEVTSHSLKVSGSNVFTYISTDRNYVTGHNESDMKDYYIYKLQKDNVPKLIVYLREEWDKKSFSKSNKYYKCEKPKSPKVRVNDCVEITEKEYNKLLSSLAKEDTNIKWTKINDAPDVLSNQSDISNVLDAYDDYMHTNYNSSYGNVRISLLYINDDDIPEAIIEQDDNIEWAIIGYDGKKVVFLAGCEADNLSYVPRGNGFYFDWCDGEESGTVCYKMDGSSIKECNKNELGKDFFMKCVMYEGKFFSHAEEAYINIEK